MEKTVVELQAAPKPADEAKRSLTPHELYNYHILHPDEPITDEDIRNLKIDSGAVYRDHQLTEEENVSSTISAQESRERDLDREDDSTSGERPKASPFDILGG